MLAAFNRGVKLFREQLTGVGPLFNNATCEGCHFKDGRGALDSAGAPVTNLLLKLVGSPLSVYGEQLQTQTAGDAAAVGEANLTIGYSAVPGHFDDGARYELSLPTYQLTQLQAGPLPVGIGLSPRLAPAMTGMGLLSAIPADMIRAAADPNDRDGDGISGRTVEVFDPVWQATVLGRFGWKADAGSVAHQVAGALFNDMGLTTSAFPEPGQTPEFDDQQLTLMEFYSAVLAVPERRGWDSAAGGWKPQIAAGEQLFHAAGCGGCHTPRWQTGQFQFSPLVAASGLFTAGQLQKVEAALSHQTIYPYTDMLLHDLGGSCEPLRPYEDGVQTYCNGLADTAPGEGAAPGEWRTPPLWGIGLALRVKSTVSFLHDGRAQDVQEAILWHGGEAAAARAKFLSMSSQERAQLLEFINSL